MVLPVQGLPGGKPKKGKKGKGAPGEGVQVNLIVDPSMFGRDSERGREEEEDWQGDDDATEALPGSYSGASSAGRQRRSPRRRGIFAGLAMEEQWRKARKVLKWGTTVDVFAMLLWGMEFVVILLGKRCPVGGFEGWYVFRPYCVNIRCESLTSGIIVGAMRTTLRPPQLACCASRSA